MLQDTADTPFHAGELEAQSRAGVGDVAQWAGGFIRDYLPAQHRDFHTSLPFLVLSGADANGLTWVTLVDGSGDFIGSPDARTLTLDTFIDDQDPLAAAFNAGTDVGAVGIELASRRRNRFSGYFRKTDTGYAIDIRQTFGNCPQYIHERTWFSVARNTPAQALSGTELTASQIALIQSADTMFIGSGHQTGEDMPSRGYDASHRGGAPGFVHVSDASHLHIPDYAGNNFFNTIGNLITDPHVGLVFIDFETGSLLHISGRATLDWQPTHTHDPDAGRMINVEIDAVIERPGVMAIRWAKQDHLSRRFKVARRVKEAQDITSFYLVPVDGKPAKPFKAGQHLPIEVQIPGQIGTSKRSYSLSGAPDATHGYRLSIKREDKGIVSRYFHDKIGEGAILEASNPSGDFVVPCSECPLVLVSVGVGLTPMVSMLHATLSDEKARPVWFVHGARNGAEHALRDEVAKLVSQHPSVQQRIFYSRPEAKDLKGKHYDKDGRVTARALLALDAGAEARYMLCGPARFLSDIRKDLEKTGIPPENIHVEAFGPASNG
ncbi:pyridoxamine 5'-phosphate oxidase family protein [Rhodobacteraceae bacterium B1Z28]|uniref:Pyridoxamine 5'-phosphate oxidase family protein n=1 Tax=Ruegeria haliotis TaxID=2747601 RepID=A0ABX2PVR8_9RHOB|nr:pyridoxamine 5'-phosphate oxidase family protein [Ruegeria haliotis]NVO58283.1 pyridoxamine 5'-phosphate oxidase family protein [Ruegeria haliotis]